jgi:hypothetical protein
MNMVSLMIANFFPTLPELYIEFESRLDALETFLHELEGDPGAPSFLLRYVDRLRCDLAGESRIADDLRERLKDLRQVISHLDDAESWSLAREAHLLCRASFAQLKRDLRTTPSILPPTLPFEWAY